jgi:CRP-like cAMP-binding protein
MAEPTVKDRSHLRDLAALDKLERGALPGEIFARGGSSRFFTEFSQEDIVTLAGYMDGYRARAGDILIREGDAGDYMLVILEGEIDILKRDARGEQQHVTTSGAGMTIGEMSMIDGEPRFATCVATTPTVFAVLTRENMAKVMLEHPVIGAKVLVRLITMLSARLRQASLKLLSVSQGQR